MKRGVKITTIDDAKLVGMVAGLASIVDVPASSSCTLLDRRIMMERGIEDLMARKLDELHDELSDSLTEQIDDAIAEAIKDLEERVAQLEKAIEALEKA